MKDWARIIFFSLMSESPPWICYFCEEEIWFKNGKGGECLAVHHINHDRADNRNMNLAPAHIGCHTRYHDWIRRLVGETEERLAEDQHYESLLRLARGDETVEALEILSGRLQDLSQAPTIRRERTFW